MQVIYTTACASFVITIPIRYGDYVIKYQVMCHFHMQETGLYLHRRIEQVSLGRGVIIGIIQLTHDS